MEATLDQTQELESLEKPTAICIEDQLNWRTYVTERVSEAGVPFSEIIAAASFEEAQPAIRRARGPLVLFVDLRFEDKTVHWDGLLWVLDELEEQLRNNPRTTVFIISGNLDNVAVAALESRGIDPARIFKKSRWADTEEEERFMHELRLVVGDADRLGVVNMHTGIVNSKVDIALLQHVAAASSVVESACSLPQRTFPFLIRVASITWSASRIPDLEVLGKIGTIFACRGTLASLNALQADSQVLNVEASSYGGVAECELSLPMIRAIVGGERRDETGDRCIVGLIDTGIDVLHDAFRDEHGRSRILAIWDQTDRTGPAPPGRQTGTLHDAQAIAQYVAEGSAPMKIGYGDHGTHVASIAAGRWTETFGGGVAPGAYLVVVIPDMESLGADEGALGYSASHLTAVAFITDLASALNMPVVINVSLGTNAGAHDGTSDLEVMFDLATDNGSKPGVAIVKSAGNERNRHGHAVVQTKSGAQEILRWSSSAEFRQRDVIEGWFKSSDRIRFRLLAPNGMASAWVGRSLRGDRGYTTNGARYQIDYVRFHRNNGESRIRIQLEQVMDAVIDEGVWTLEIEGEDVRGAGIIDFWIGKEMSRSVEFMSHAAEDATLTVPATARHVLAVGSVCRTLPTRLADSSSLGPTRDGRCKPELVAPGEGILAAASRTRSKTVAQSGTSMAAPHVAGAIALAFSKQRKLDPNGGLNASQVYAALTQSCQQFNGQWHKGLGFGLLDVEAFLRDLG